MISRQEPFPDHVDTGSFYDGGSRKDIVDNIKSALGEDVALITLTGTDGSGKTMVCRMVQQELSDDKEVIFLEKGVESFDEVVNLLAAQIGIEELDQISDRKIRLEKAIELLRDSDRRFIIIIDSAETIFLATLERIRRMLDEVNADRFCIQLILSGGPLLALNYKQLAIIAFKPVEEQHLSLDPLDGEDTFTYLNHCLKRAGIPEKEYFTRAQAENIADVSRGNFRLINQLGGRFFDPERKVDLDEADIEELYHGISTIREDGAYEKISSGLKNVDLDFLKVPRLGARWYMAGGGLIVLILLLFMLLRGGGEDPEELPGSVDVPELTLENVEPDPIEIPEPSIPQVPAAGTAPEVISEHSVDDSAVAIENETPADVDATETAMEDESQPEPSAAPQPAQSGNQGESVEREMKQPVVAEPDAAGAEPLEAETETAEVEPLKPENEIEPAAATAVAQPPENEPPETVTSAVDDDLASADRLAAISLEKEPVPEVVPSEAVVEPEETAQDSSGTKSILIPQLAVVPRKLPSTESVPFEVVTLNQESKVKPEEGATAEVVEAESEEPGPASEPEALPSQQRNEQEEAETVTSEQQPVLTTPAKIAEVEAIPEPVRTTTAPLKNPDIYYAERLAAGSRWLVGGSSRKYTVQLMVLNAEDAQDNVRDMLVEDGYRSIMDKLYILKKSGQPQTVMLYYGEFDSSAEARQAKAQLPSFLDKLEPYELAVREAVAKARAGQ